MAIHSSTTSMPAHPDLTRAQITALQTHGSKATRIALLSDSQPALTNPLLTCLICIHPYHSANVEGNIETPVITACGHIFGDKCIKQWLKDDNWGSGTGKTCPMCRFVLKYRECGCVIKAVPAFDPPPPPKITESQVPLRCGRCEIRRLISAEKERYDDVLFSLYDTRAELSEHIDVLEQAGAREVDGVWTLLTRQQMEETRPEDWAALCEAQEELKENNRNIKEARALRQELEREKMKELAERGGWFL